MIMFVICLSTEANIQGGKKKVSEQASLPLMQRLCSKTCLQKTFKLLQSTVFLLQRAVWKASIFK